MYKHRLPFKIQYYEWVIYDTNVKEKRKLEEGKNDEYNVFKTSKNDIFSVLIGHAVYAPCFQNDLKTQKTIRQMQSLSWWVLGRRFYSLEWRVRVSKQIFNFKILIEIGEYIETFPQT